MIQCGMVWNRFLTAIFAASLLVLACCPLRLYTPKLPTKMFPTFLFSSSHSLIPPFSSSFTCPPMLRFIIRSFSLLSLWEEKNGVDAPVCRLSGLPLCPPVAAWNAPFCCYHNLLSQFSPQHDDAVYPVWHNVLLPHLLLMGLR